MGEDPSGLLPASILNTETSRQVSISVAKCTHLQPFLGGGIRAAISPLSPSLMTAGLHPSRDATLLGGWPALKPHTRQGPSGPLSLLLLPPLTQLEPSLTIAPPAELSL